MRPTVDDIRRTVAIPLARRGVVRAGIFGSFARGEATASSDIDFLVEFEKGRTLLDLSGLRLDLCEALDREVDVALAASEAAGSDPSQARSHPMSRSVDVLLGEILMASDLVRPYTEG